MAMADTNHFRILVLLGVLFFQNCTEASSPLPPSPEQQRIYKESKCKDLLDLQAKLPAKFGEVMNHIQTDICADPKGSVGSIARYLEYNLSYDDYLELRLTQVGKTNYCSYIMGLTQLWTRKDTNPMNTKDSQVPELQQFKEKCEDPNATEADILPLAQTLGNLYYHF